jgi:hypothetical protein
VVVVVVEVGGATGIMLEDCSVVVVLVDLSLPQPASATVPATRTMLVSNRRPDFLLVMGISA